MKKHGTVLATLGFAALIGNALPAVAQTLGTASGFAVLGATTVTNTGSTVVAGDLGVYPNSAPNAITGFPPGIVIGTVHPADAIAQQAQADATTAYNFLAAMSCNTDMTGQDLGGKTLTPGVYCFSSSVGLTGTLTLDAQGNPGAIWVFQIGSTITTASDSNVLVINGGSPCNAFWQVGSSATLGTRTAFAGNILALTSITMTTGVTLAGRAIALNAAVTMDTNGASIAACGLGATPTPTSTPTSTPSPTPTLTPTLTSTPTSTPSPTPLFTATPGPSPTPTSTPTSSPSPTPTLTATTTPSSTPTLTPTTTPSSTTTPTTTPTVPGGPPPPVPTLSGWAMIAFGGLLAMVALVVMRRGV